MPGPTGELIFDDRIDAGRQLAEAVLRERLEGEIIVLALPRGGVPVAAEVAAALGAPLDVLIVRKLGAPFNPELAIGAIALGGVVVFNEPLLSQLALDPAAIDAIRDREAAELERRERAYRGPRPAPVIAGRTAIVVDDGVATGATMLAAVAALRVLGPREIVVAVPTCAADASLRLGQAADRVVALSTPEPYIAVGAWYRYFDQLSDDEVVTALADHTRNRGRNAGRPPSRGD